MKYPITCPNCNKEYLPILERKTNEVIQKESEQREQLISGLCSTKCWNEYLGIPTIKNNHSNVKGKVFKARIFENIERNTEVKK